MNQITLSAIDALIESFEKNTYTDKHVESLLNYLSELDELSDSTTIKAITKVLGFCTKDFVKLAVVERLKNDAIPNHVKAALLTSCWESGLDYSLYADVVVNAMLNGNEAVAIEAYTVICECSDTSPSIKKAIEAINNSEQKNYTPAHRILINDSLHHLITLNNQAN